MNKKFSTLGKISRLFLLVLLFCVAGLANAQTFTVGNLNYSLNSDGASVTVTGHVDGTAATGELVIPESVELYGVEYPVTIIGNSAFYNCSGLTGSLVIPNSVITINNNAFYNCSGLTGALTIGNSVETIGSYAFYKCGFTGVLTIPESVTTLDVCAFGYCNFTAIEYNARDCKLYYYSSSSGNAYWFTGSNSVTSLTIGEHVEKIPGYFLCNFTSITGSLVVPNSVTSIGANAFNGCTGLSGTLTIGFSVTEIGNAAFFGACQNFTSYVFFARCATNAW